MSERELPNSALSEAGLISIFLHDPDGKIISEELERGLKPSMFYSKRLKLILCACLELYAESKPVNKEGVVEILTRRGKLGDVGQELVDELDAKKENEANAIFYTETIKEKAFRRKLIKLAQKAVQMDFPKDATTDEIADAVTKVFQSAGCDVSVDDVAEATACRHLVQGKVRELFEEAKRRGYNMRGTLRILTSLVGRLNMRAR